MQTTIEEQRFILFPAFVVITIVLVGRHLLRAVAKFIKLGFWLILWVLDVLFEELLSPFTGLAERPQLVSEDVLPRSCLATVDFGHVYGSIPSVPAADPLVTLSRVRPRARWVRRLEEQLVFRKVGLFVRGRWTPDLTSRNHPAEINFILRHLREGGRVVGGGSVQRRKLGAAKDGSDVIYVVVELPDGSREFLVPDLVSLLAQYVLLRQRSPELVGAVRSRARDYCRSHLPESLAFDATCSAMKLALSVSPAEELLESDLANMGLKIPPLFSLE